MKVVEKSRAIAVARGKDLRNRRTSLGLTEAQLAEFTGLSATSIGITERGQYDITDAEWERQTALYRELMTILWGIDAERFPTFMPKQLPVNETTKLPTPEAPSDDDLYEPASGNCAGKARTFPGVAPAPFYSNPSLPNIPPGGVSEGGRAGQAFAPNHGPRGLPFPSMLKPHWTNWGDLIGDCIGAFCLFASVAIALFIGAALS